MGKNSLSTRSLMEIGKNSSIDYMHKYKTVQEENPGVIKQPKAVLIAGIVGMIFWSILTILLFVSLTDKTDMVIAGVIMGILWAAALYLVLNAKNFLITYKGGKIEHRNTLGITRTYNCQDIEAVYYTNSGGMKFLFKDGRKLKFSKDEELFCQVVLDKEGRVCAYEETDKTIIKVYGTMFLSVPFFLCGFLMLLACILHGVLVVFGSAFFLFMSSFLMDRTTYDRETKILTRRRFGFPKKFDMNVCCAEPLYNGEYIVYLEIKKDGKKVGKVPASREYTNRIHLIHDLCEKV